MVIGNNTIFEKRPEVGKEASHAGIYRKRIQAKGTAIAEVLRWKHASQVEEQSGAQCGWDCGEGTRRRVQKGSRARFYSPYRPQ